MTGSVKSFKAKLLLWMSDMKMKFHVDFLNMKKVLGDGAFSPLPFVHDLQTLLEQS
jgi:hypothetical protein